MMQYQRSIISYLDLLGFRDIIARCPEPALVQELLMTFTHSSSSKPVMGSPVSAHRNKGFKTIRASCFSDLAVRVTPLAEQGQEYVELVVADEAACVSEIQMELTYRGVVLRGAITIGNVFIDETLVFGPGLIRAYELESRSARYPRVVIDPEVFRDLNSAIEDDTEPLRATVRYRGLHEAFREGSDGLWFVDYLGRWLWNDLRHGDAGIAEEHGNLIRRELKRSARDARLAEKYEWLRAYHNEVVEEVDDAILVKVGSSKAALKVEP